MIRRLYVRYSLSYAIYTTQLKLCMDERVPSLRGLVDACKMRRIYLVLFLWSFMHNVGTDINKALFSTQHEWILFLF